MENKNVEILSVGRKLLSFSFKRIKSIKDDRKLKQEYNTSKIEFIGNRAEFLLVIKQFHVPSCFFKTQVEFKIVVTFSKQINENVFNDNDQKELINNSIEDAFADNSLLIAFFTDRVFDSPLVLPPIPMDMLKNYDKEKEQ